MTCSSALDLLRKRPDQSIGLVVTDPPLVVADFRRTIREMGRVVRPGGGLVVIGTHQSTRQWDRLAHRSNFDYVADMVVLWDTPVRDASALGSVHSRVVWFTRKGLRSHADRFPDSIQRLRSNVLVCKRVPMQDRVHPSEKPVGLTNLVISLLSMKTDTVADVYCGSGSTLVSAVQCGRRFIGCDIDAENVVTANRRLIYADDEDAAPVYLWINGVQHEI